MPRFPASALSTMPDIDLMARHADAAAQLLKSLAHPARLPRGSMLAWLELRWPLPAGSAPDPRPIRMDDESSDRGAVT